MALRLLQGARAQTERHRLTPPGKPEPFLHFFFCRTTCGVRTYASGDHLPSFGGLFYAIAIAALDEVDADELAATPVQYIDGRHNRFDQAPEDYAAALRAFLI